MVKPEILKRPRIIVIVAFNHYAAKTYAQAAGWLPQQWIYCDYADRIRGLENPLMIYLENWRRGKTPEACREIEEVARTLQRPMKRAG